MLEFEGEEMAGFFGYLQEWLFSEIIIIDNLVSFLVLMALVGLSYLLRKRVLKRGEQLLSFLPDPVVPEALEFWQEIYLQLSLAVFIGFYSIFASVFNLPEFITSIAGYLLTAWLIIRFITWFLPDTIWVQLLSYLVWIIAVLNILGIYAVVVEFLEGIELNLGEFHLSVMLVLRGILVFAFLFWVAGFVEKSMRNRLRTSDDLTPSIRVLLQKILRIVIYITAFFIGLSSIGIDLSAFAFMGGAVGVGLGFGLQKIVSNFVSGIIIILDKSIKPGDVVEIDEVFGQVRSLNSRYVDVVARSGKEFLIPNENFITSQVINWSYSDNYVRVDLDIGVGYDSDLKRVRELIMEASEDKERLLSRPEPRCLVKNFGDNTVDFQLRFWINDPEEGVDNIKSELMMDIWELFHENGINIAFPQRDLHLESISEEAAARMKEIWQQQEES